jgi:hypothetical protein
MQSKTLEQLTPTAAQAILANLPERIRQAFIDRSTEIDFPVDVNQLDGLRKRKNF